jgi:hypothetical protein
MLEHLVGECDGHGRLAGCPIIEALLGNDGPDTTNTLPRKG